MPLHYKAWLALFQHVLPCCCCRAHFAKHVAEFQIDPGTPNAPTGDFANTRSFFRMVCRIHNAVNLELGKTAVDEAGIERLYAFYTSCKCGSSALYGRALVVMQPAAGDPVGPADCAGQQTDSIVVHRSILQQECRGSFKPD